MYVNVQKNSIIRTQCNFNDNYVIIVSISATQLSKNPWTTFWKRWDSTTTGFWHNVVSPPLYPVPSWRTPTPTDPCCPFRKSRAAFWRGGRWMLWWKTQMRRIPCSVWVFCLCRFYTLEGSGLLPFHFSPWGFLSRSQYYQTWKLIQESGTLWFLEFFHWKIAKFHSEAPLSVT